MSIFGTPSTSYGGPSNPSSSSIQSNNNSVNTSVGDLLVVVVNWTGITTVTSVTDLAGNSFIPGTLRTNAGGNQQFFYCLAATHADATNEFIANFSAGSTFVYIAAWDVPLTGGTAAFDIDVNWSGSANGATAVFSTAGTDEIAFINGYGTTPGTNWTAPTSWTLDGPGTNYCAAAHGVYTSAQTNITEAFATFPTASVAILIAIKAIPPSGSSISGNAGIAGATVAYSGTASGSVTADGSGNYTITGLANGGYTITPSKTGYVFSPTSASETVSGSNITGVNFTATPSSRGGTLLLIISD